MILGLEIITIYIIDIDIENRRLASLSASVAAASELSDYGKPYSLISRTKHISMAMAPAPPFLLSRRKNRVSWGQYRQTYEIIQGWTGSVIQSIRTYRRCEVGSDFDLVCLDTYTHGTLRSGISPRLRDMP